MINIENNDEFCFLWSVTAALKPAERNKCSSVTSSYPHFSSVLEYKNLEFPMRLDDIQVFEKMNDLRVNVYGFNEKQQIVPY